MREEISEIEGVVKEGGKYGGGIRILREEGYEGVWRLII